MKYTEKLLQNESFKNVQEAISQWEISRIYCHHELSHCMDVARMAWIYFLEDCQKKHLFLEDLQLEEKKDFIYVCALLHDIGRAKQYETGIHHSVCGQKLAEGMLLDIGAPESWKEAVLRIVAGHHACDRSSDPEWKIADYIDRADHDCRPCFCCEGKDTCKWSREERNHTLVC